jgi:hypothetical protein
MSLEAYPLISEARYDHPVSTVDKSIRNALDASKTLVVLCTYIPRGLTFKYVSKFHTKTTFFEYFHDRLACLEFVLSCYKHFDAGAPYDLLIIDNDSPSERTQHYFQNLDVPVIQRENTYYSFGAYKAAWDQFKDDYDYFVFHEMDWTPCQQGWLQIFIDLWNSDPEIGMIGNLIEVREWSENPQNNDEYASNMFIEAINPNRLLHYNLDSEYLFTDKHVLRLMDDTGWPIFFKCLPEVEISPAYNELAFQQPILEMGYKLRCFNDGDHTMFYGTYNRDFPSQWDNGLEKLAPFIPEQVRLFIPQFCDYFDFYDHVEHNSLFMPSVL